MFKVKVFLFLSLIKNTFCPCVQDKKHNTFEKPGTRYHKEKIAKLPAVVNESSGLVMKTDSSFWTLNDGGAPLIYEIDLQGNLLSETRLPNSSNKDWEEITTDHKGNLYIGDFGNNSNARRDLRIFRYDTKLHKTDTISFSYTDQPDFPPEKRLRNYDCEAMFHYKDSLYLISKNRGEKTVRFYKLPDQPGVYAIKPFYTTYISSMITGAAIDKDQKKIALLSYGKVYFFELDPASPNLLKPCSCLGFARNGQAEGIDFAGDHSLMITNEQGKVFRVKQNK